MAIQGRSYRTSVTIVRNAAAPAAGGNQSVTAQIGILTFSGIAGTAMTNQTVTAQIGTLTFTGVAGNATLALSKTAQIATLTFTPQAGAPCNTPDAPTSLAAVPASGQVGLTWTAPSGTITDYVVQYRTAGGGGFTYPASVDSTHRKLLDQSGNVVMMHTFSSWGMSQNLSNANITVALEALRAKGFNAVTVSPCGQNYGGSGGTAWDRYHNLAGDPYFTGTEYSSTLGAAWSSMDWIVSEAARLGMFVLFSLYSGSGNTQGGGDEMIAAGTTNMYNHGVRVATRYASANNIVWHYGADQDFNYGTAPSQVVDAYFHGIRDTEGATHRIVVAEPGQYPTTSYNQFNNQGYTYFHTDVNSVYQYFQDPLTYFDNVWNESGATSMPVWDCEPPYLQAPYYSDEDSAQRARHYTTYIRGGCGINLSDETWWPFGKAPIFGTGTWTDTPTKAPFIQMGYAINLIDSYMLDLTWAPVSTLVTTGASTDVAQGASNTAAIAYIPSSRTLALNTTIIAGTGNVRLRWFDPSNNTFTSITTSEAQQTGRSITHPGNNSVGDTDWILVVDEAGSTHTPPPGGWQTFADGTSSSTGATVTGLTNGTAYDFHVAAVTACGQGVYTAAVSATPNATQTTNAQIGTLTFTGIAGTKVAGGVSTSAQIGTITFTGIAGTEIGGPASKTAQIGALTFTPIAGTTIGGPTSLTAQIGSLTFTPIAGVPTPGNFSQTAQIGTLTFTGIPGSLTGGPTSLTAQIGTLTFTGVPGTAGTGTFKVAQQGILTFEGVPGSPFGGPVSQSAQIGLLTFSGIPGSNVAGPVSQTAQIGLITFAGIPGTPGTGGSQVTAQVGLLSFAGIPGGIVGGPASLGAQVGLLTFSGVPGSPSQVGPGAQTTNAQVGLLTFTAIPATYRLDQTTLAQIGNLTFVALPGNYTGSPLVAAQVGLISFEGVPGHPFLGAIVVNGYGRVGILRFEEPGVIHWMDRS